MTKQKILSISYDESLLITRQMLLEQAGYEVLSALGFTEALKHCNGEGFSLVTIGHSIPRSDKESLVAAVKAGCKAPILSLRRHGDLPVPGADHSIEVMEGPAALLAAVAKTLKRKKPAGSEKRGNSDASKKTARQ